MPKYLVKWPDETAFMAALASVGAVITVIMNESGQSAAMTGAVVTAILSVGRLVYGVIAPTPTVTEEIDDVIDHT
jgi:hypothetical protein